MITTPPASTSTVRPQTVTRPPCIGSEELLRGGRIVEIDHAGQRYTLRVTKENKLILTK